MALNVITPGWRKVGAARSAGPAAPAGLQGLRADFVPEGAEIEEAVIEPAPPARGRAAAPPRTVDLTADVKPGQTAILAVRLPSGALTFHPPLESVSRSAGGPPHVRFQVPMRSSTTRGLVGSAIKVIVVKVAKMSADKLVSFALPKIAEAVERAMWKKRGLKEGWLKVTRDSLAARALASGAPDASGRTLLLIHGTFSNAAAAYASLAKSNFFDRVKPLYGDRVFAFDHFTISRKPEDNVRLLLEGLPAGPTTFDVVTHSRGGLVLRTLVEQSSLFPELSSRFRLGRAVLVASPNDGTPLATPKRWDETVGWIANLLELFPDNPFTTGAEFVANALVWLANHASGDLPGLHAMDGQGEVIEAIQGPPGPPDDAYSALVSNYQPSGQVLQRLLDVGIDQFFASANDLVVPSEGGWHIEGDGTAFIPSARIGCFGPGGNLPGDSVTHVNFFSNTATVDFLVNALSGRSQAIGKVDPRKALPNRRLVRGIADVPAPATTRARSSEAEPAEVEEAATTALKITVVNGDLAYIAEPLLIGHYRSIKLTGAEKAMDLAIGKAMSASLQRGLYPDAVGTHQIFVNTRQIAENPWQLPRPAAVIVAGLGAEGELRGTDLVLAVRQAVIAWSQRLTESSPTPVTFSMATTLLGSGGLGIDPGQAAQLIAQGIREANEQLAGEHAGQKPWPQVDHLRIVELYLDRAGEAWRSLQALAAGDNGLYTVGSIIEPGIGALRRTPDSGYRGVDYDFISALVETDDKKVERIVYTVDTKRARSEVRAQATQVPLIRNLVATGSNNTNTDEEIGHTLFNLLVPVDLEPFVASSAATVIELDTGTAGIPWELLDNQAHGEGNEPWAIRTTLLRKLKTPPGSAAVRDASADDDILVIGDPACDRTKYPKLYGARREAAAVIETLRRSLSDSKVDSLVSDDDNDSFPNARAVVSATLKKAWRIVHIAGHGDPPSDADARGVVLTDDLFLGPTEIGALRHIPELVFVNCCYLARAAEEQFLKQTNYDRARFASGVAESLIKAGVRCVVAAGWAVDDGAAEAFATTFYAKLGDGETFLKAVAAARKAAWARGGNTWAAYQCYGDPDWRYRRETQDAQRPAPPPDPAQEFASIASASALVLALETLAVKSEFQHADSAAQADRLRYLQETYARFWSDNGQVAEAFGNAWAQAGDFEEAVGWYEQARTAADGTSPLTAIEQLANLKVRIASAKVAGANAAEAAVQAAARKDITEAMSLLDILLAVGPTLERESLYGSAYKRLAYIEAIAGNDAAETAAITSMMEHYTAAERIARKKQEENPATIENVFYPAMNRIAAQLALQGGTEHVAKLDGDTLKAVRDSMLAMPPDFWSVVGQSELKMYEALSAGTLEQQLQAVSADFEAQHARVSARKRWMTVHDNAAFVLKKYISRAAERESKAAGLLLDLLARLAGRQPQAAPPESPAAQTEPTPAPAPNAAPAHKRAGKRSVKQPARPRTKRRRPKH